MTGIRFSWVICSAVLWMAACGDPEKDDTDTENTDSSDEGDEACLAGYDGNAPVLRFRAIVPTEPVPLADIAAGTQGAVDDETLNYVLTMDDFSEGDTVTGKFGVGEKADADDTFRFTDDSAEMTFAMTGDAFVSQGDVAAVLVVPLIEGEVLSVPLQEVTLEGEFTTPEHCSIGSRIAEGPPSEWEPGGEMSGLLTVEDAKAITVTVAGRTFTLCAYLAYGVSAALPDADTECAAEMTEWTYPPEDAVAAGDDAWRVSADFAATAVYLE